MFRFYTAVSLIALMSACGSGTQPFNFAGTDAGTTSTTTTTTGTTDEENKEDTGTLETGTSLPDGSASPTAANAIQRYEAKDSAGGGLVTSVTYNKDDNEFTVDNLGFDGANVYTKGIAVDTLGVDLQQYRVYQAADFVPDALDGDPIEQNGPYRAIIGVSKNAVDEDARTSFAIVRTGGYRGYGFGGFLYERNGSVTLPTTGQAHFAGEYAGIRVINGRSGLEYTTGDMTIDIDFADFNANDAVNGKVTERLAFDVNGLPIATGAAGQLLTPDIYFTVVEGGQSLTENGEISGSLSNTIINDQGTAEVYETGTYYGILGGDLTDAGDGGELVGLFVVTSNDPRYEDEGYTAQETGGFILYR